MPVQKIAAFMGVIGSGKDYQLQLLKAEDPDLWVQIDFKDALIDMVEDLVGFPIRGRYDEFKEFIIGFQHPNVSLAATLQRDSVSLFNKQCVADYPQAMTGRRLLQRLGTDVMRKRDPDYWVHAWAKSTAAAIASGKNVVCADCRFLNEMLVIEELGKQLQIDTSITFCDYHSKRYDANAAHESERLAQQLLASGIQDLTSIDYNMAVSAAEKAIVHG